MEAIDLTKLNKAEVLAKLYNNSQPLGMGMMNFTPEEMTTAEAQELLDSGQTYFDYVKGRAMKIDLSGDELRTGLYDRDNGAGAAKAALGL